MSICGQFQPIKLQLKKLTNKNIQNNNPIYYIWELILIWKQEPLKSPTVLLLVISNNASNRSQAWKESKVGNIATVHERAGIDARGPPMGSILRGSRLQVRR